MNCRAAMHFLLAIVWLFACMSVTHAADGPTFRISALPLTTKAQKQQGVTGGEGYQLVMSIAYAPSDPNIVYLASDTSQVWKSLNAGESWEPANTGYKALGSRSLFVHPLNPDIVFSAGSLGMSFNRVGHKSPHQGIYRSTDGGEHWDMVLRAPFFKQDSHGSLFAIDSRTLRSPKFTLFVGTHDGDLLVSHDSGTSWENTGFSTSPIRQILELPDAPGTLLVASEQGLQRYDGEASRRIGEGLPTWPRSIAVSADRPGVVYAALGNHGVFKSIDGGEHFQSMLATLPHLGVVNDIEISPVDADIAIFTRSGKLQGPYYTHDGGQNWKAAKSINARGLTEGGGFFFASPIAMHPSDAMTALTSSNGKAKVLLSSDGGQNWSYSGSGYRGGRLMGVVFMSPQEMILNLTDHGAWQTVDGGVTFEPVRLPRQGGKSVGGGAMSDNTLVLTVGSWSTKHLLVSQDRGRSWGNTGLSGRMRVVRSHGTDNHVFYASNYRSEDKGRSWTKLRHRIAAVDPSRNDTVYAVEASSNRAQLLLSSDRGDNWKAVGAPLPVTVKAINRIEVDPFETARVYAATARGLWTLVDGQWVTKNESAGLLPDHFGSQFIETVVAHPKHPGLLFAGKRSPGMGMGNGLFYSSNHGENWQPIPGASLSNTNIWSINVNPYDGNIYIGTSHGIYRVELLEGVV